MIKWIHWINWFKWFLLIVFNVCFFILYICNFIIFHVIWRKGHIIEIKIILNLESLLGYISKIKTGLQSDKLKTILLSAGIAQISSGKIIICMHVSSHFLILAIPLVTLVTKGGPLPTVNKMTNSVYLCNGSSEKANCYYTVNQGNFATTRVTLPPYSIWDSRGSNFDIIFIISRKVTKTRPQKYTFS